MKLMTTVLLYITFSFPLSASAAPQAELWPHWLKHNPKSQATITHTEWNHFLTTYIHTQRSNAGGTAGINRLSYAEVTADDKQVVKRYITRLTELPISEYNRSQQRAYWINLYNALTVDVVLNHYPVESIMDIKLSGFFTRGPWKKKLITVEQQPLSLNDIEHRILRPIWNDPRTHYAVNCASIGCPNLTKHAYTADNMEQLLDQAAHDFINHPKGVEIKNGKLILSSIYIWFREDFGNKDDQIIAHLQRYAEAPLKQQLLEIPHIYDNQYNWELNDKH